MTASQHTSAVPLLPLGQYRAVFCAIDPVVLPAYPGSAWRGAFGHALKHSLCVTRTPACEDCALWRSCAYAYVFETPPPPHSEKLRKYTAAPHPFVLDIDLRGGRLAPGTPYELGFTLIGRGNQHLAYVVHALGKAGMRGIGTGQGRLRLERVEQWDAAQLVWVEIHRPEGECRPLPITAMDIPPLPPAVRMVLETPLRLKRNSGVLGTGDFSFGPLFGNLLRRISMLTYFHTDHPLDTDFAGLSQAARALPLREVRLRWFDWKRYSSRQRREMALGGLLGEFQVDGAELAPFWPYLWLGQYVHAGAVTSMGLGRYRIEALASLPPETATPAPCHPPAP